MTKLEQMAERAIVTFFEAALAYAVVIPHVVWDKTAIAGVIGAGLSAVYNFLRESTPTLPTLVVPEPTVTVVTPVETPSDAPEEVPPVAG